jgi:Flp pilus assembly protein TadG
MTHIRFPNRLRRTASRSRLGGAEDGQALVELALVLPLLLVLVFGIVQLSLAANSANDETHLANEVARYAIVNENPSSKALARWGSEQLDSSVLKKQTVCIRFLENQVTKTSRQVGDPVEVLVKGTMNWLAILKLKVTSTVVEGKAVMRLEAPPSNYGEECA